MWGMHSDVQQFVSLLDGIDKTAASWHAQIQDDDPGAGDNLQFNPQAGFNASGQLVTENLSLTVQRHNVVYVKCEISSGNDWQVQIGRIYTSDSDMSLLEHELAQLCNNCELELLISYYVFVNILSRTLADLGGIRWYDTESTRECLRTLASASHPQLEENLLKRIGLFACACAIDPAHSKLREFANELCTINRALLNCPDLPGKREKLKARLTEGIERCLFVMRYNAFGQTCQRSGVSKTSRTGEVLTYEYFLGKIEADSDFASKFIRTTFDLRFYPDWCFGQYFYDIGRITGNMEKARMLVRICNTVLENCDPDSLPIWRLILAGERSLLLDFVADNAEVFEKYFATRNTYGIALFHQIFISLGPDLTDLTFLSKYYDEDYRNITSIIGGRGISTLEISEQLNCQVPWCSSKNPSQEAVSWMLAMAQQAHNDEPPDHHEHQIGMH